MFTEQVQSRSQQKTNTHARITHAASRLFLSAGPSVTVRQVADAAGVSVGSVMGVADKDGLIVHTLDAVLAEVGAHPSRTAADDAAAVTQLLRPFVEWFSEHADLARAYLAILVSGRHRSEVFDTLAEQLIGTITAVLEHHPDAESRARLIHRAYLGELMIWAGSNVTDPEHTLAEIEASVRAAIGTERRHGTHR
ncbi:TetR/AcrR family transcriptional regulator [Microbacterium sp.]|uniref:TetR/AcrR family transcriptional regulator n=1 Tax=Microbacterium sp. TaxID=51671 RepID=UPI003C243A17